MEIYSHCVKRLERNQGAKAPALIFMGMHKINMQSSLSFNFSFIKLFLAPCRGESPVLGFSCLTVVGTCTEFVISLLPPLLLQGRGGKQKHQMAAGAQLCSSTNTS